MLPPSQKKESKSIETESKLVVAYGWGIEGDPNWVQGFFQRS